MDIRYMGIWVYGPMWVYTCGIIWMILEVRSRKRNGEPTWWFTPQLVGGSVPASYNLTSTMYSLGPVSPIPGLNHQACTYTIIFMLHAFLSTQKDAKGMYRIYQILFSVCLKNGGFSLGK